MASDVSSPPASAQSSEAPTLRRPAGFVPTDMPRRFGRYALLRRIAKGGMGEVCLAATLGLEGAERPVIVKTIRAEHRTDASFKARFLDEARVQAQLEHSGVAQVFEATTDDESGEPYVVVEYVDGRSLGEVRSRALASNHALGWHEAVAIAQLAAEALAHVHERRDPQGRPLSIVHRDLSPQNLMVSYGGEVKIIDFGTARGENRRCHTVAGVVYAKPGYTAPEVANGDSGDFRVDLYALGVMLWELCAGRRFLVGDATDHLAAVSKNERNLPPVAASVGAPAELDAVITRLSSFDREARYPKTRDAARELAALLGCAPTLPSGERGVRGRIASTMSRLFEGDSARARREFLKLVAEARRTLGPMPVRTPAAPTPQAAIAMRDEEQGMLPGTRWKLSDELGRGASSVVYEADHADLGRRAAIKVLHSAEAEGEPVEKLRREARVLASLSGVAGIARVIDVGRSLDHRAFTVMELREGRTLERRNADRNGPMPWMEALGLVERILTVFEGIHSAGVVHRDVKPGNLLVGDDGTVTVLDFGLALSSESRSESESPAPARAALEVFGTPEYMAPEQVARPHEVDARADLYALGAVLYELLTNQLPFSSEVPMGLLEQKTQGSPEAPSQRLSGVELPRPVDDLVLRAIARHPSLRFSSAVEMRAAVREAIALPGKKRARQRRWAFGAAAAALCGIAAFLGAQRPEGRAFVERAKVDLVERFQGPQKVEQLADAAAVETSPVVADGATARVEMPAEMPSEPASDLAALDDELLDGAHEDAAGQDPLPARNAAPDASAPSGDVPPGVPPGEVARAFHANAEPPVDVAASDKRVVERTDAAKPAPKKLRKAAEKRDADKPAKKKAKKRKAKAASSD
jgi:serine/threonine protein kinase